MSAATPRPWKAGTVPLEVWATDKRETVVCIVTGGISNPQAIADRELIVRAVNLHDELVATLRDAISTVAAMYDPADDDDPAPAILAQWRALVERADR